MFAYGLDVVQKAQKQLNNMHYNLHNCTLHLIDYKNA